MNDNNREAIVSLERHNFEMVPHWILFHDDVTAHAIKLYLGLRNYGQEDKVSWPSRNTLAKKLNMSISTIDRAKKLLVEIGALCQQQRKADENQNWLSNHYHLHWEPADECQFFASTYNLSDSTYPLKESTLPSQRKHPTVKNNTLIRLKESDSVNETVIAPANAVAQKAALDVITPNAGHIMADWIDRQGQRPPERVIGQLARETRKLLDEGFAPVQVTAALDSITAKGLHPSTLASELHTMGAGRKKSTAEMCLEIANSP